MGEVIGDLTRTAACPECGEPPDRYWEDVPVVRRVCSISGPKIIVEGLIEDHDYDGGHNGEWFCTNDHSWPADTSDIDWR